MSTRLHLKQTTSLVLNPVVHTFLELLPLNRLEFMDRIQNEVDSNPMLEVEDPFSKDAETSARDDETNLLEQKLNKADDSFVSHYEENGFLKPDPDRIDKNRAIELFSAEKEDLADHLMGQARTEFSLEELRIARHIIFNLNSDGYLDLLIESAASALNTTPEAIEEIRRRITGFDPQGSAARSLSECLLAQVPENPDNTKLRRLIHSHLDDLARSRYEEIMKQLEVDRKELNRLIERLRRLNPRPASRFEHDDIEYAEVDLLLIKDEHGYQVRYIEEGMPRLLISSYYQEMLEKPLDRKTRSYLKDRQRNATLFIDGLELRKKMIVRIAEFLVTQQKDFLDFGPKWKKPLTMKEVAQALNYNESTISRAVKNKFMASDRGLISLRSFFSYGIKGEFGFKHSVETVREKIQRIIESEPHAHPLSDQLIAEQLNRLGIHISRRTVRNYREELNLSNSSKRREEYKLKGE
ncbi:MAG TPA: RNA polymerase sigma-54 factor [Candidatus Aminicenantes bacterium]|nr:RNA polymerase sigma-54 factor [Candidatus Aminicenantes bacterium]